ncbi:MAG: DUF2332 family protein, partial [Alphaproteobacteria bacterium]
VWQYLPPRVRDGVRETIRAAGRVGGPPIVWARMEPAGPRADLRADAWIDGAFSRHLLADVGYHGQEFDWRGERMADQQP